MTRLFLHIGTHKTGTTSVQRFFDRHRTALREAGIWYPEMTLTGWRPAWSHHRVTHALAGIDAAKGPEDGREYFRAVREAVRPGEVVVVSAESMWRHVLPEPGAPAGTVTEDDASFARYVGRMREATADFDVAILVMLRRQDLFLESLYHAAVSNGRFRGTFAEYLEEPQPLSHYDRRLAIWADHFGVDSVHLKVYEPSTFRVPLERMFVEWVGGAWDDRYTIGPRRNVSFPWLLLEYRRRLGLAGIDESVRYRVRDVLEAFVRSPAAAELPDFGHRHFAAGERIPYVARWEACNRAVADRFLGGRELFTEPVDDSGDLPAGSRELSPDMFEIITSRMLEMLVRQGLPPAEG